MFFIIFRTPISVLQSQRALAVENLTLRHQLIVLQRTARKPRLRRGDRILWVLLSRYWATWRQSLTILGNHAKEIVSIDFFTVPTVTFRVFFVFLILSNHRRRILYFNVTANPSAAWTGRQFVEAFPWDTAPRYLIRDRDGVYGNEFIHRVEGMGIEEVPISAHSPWQNPYVERIVGSIRRGCLDHVIIFSERHLRRVLRCYLECYHGSRTHLGLEKDCPVPRPVERRELGTVCEEPMAGGLHQRYFRRAA